MSYNFLEIQKSSIDLGSKWIYWHGRICDILEVNENKSIKDQLLKKPWFLFPSEEELDEEEANGLLAIVNEYLFPTEEDKSILSVRNKLRALNPDASLIFLYAMRYVAFREAESQYYWPAFTEMILFEKLPYRDVAIRLAPETSKLWIKLYEFTSGALFYPREGKRHIKWPLSHAGLLPDDKEALENLGAALLSENGELYSEILEIEVSELIYFLRDWMETNPEFKQYRFFRLMRTESPNRDIIAELGQQWLHYNRKEIRHREDSSHTNKSIVITKRRRLFYDYNNNELKIEFSFNRLKGKKDLFLIWGGEKKSIKTQYLRSTNETIPRKTVFSLLSPNWPPKAKLKIEDNNLINVNVPTIHKDSGLVFDVVSGYQTKRWKLGGEYYIFLPGNNLNSELADKLFDELITIGSPQGKWIDYVFLWVKTIEPLSHHDDGLKDNFTNQIEEIEAATEKMGLPSFGHQFKLKTDLIGRKLLFDKNLDKPIYSVKSPPLIELRGIQKERITLDLHKKDEGIDQFAKFDNLVIEPEEFKNYHLIDLFESEAEPGAYKIDVNKIDLEFILLKRNISEGKVDSFILNAYIFEGDRDPVFDPERNYLHYYVLSISAWPYAELVLDVYYEDGENALISLPIQAGEDGNWEESLKKLPINFGNVPPGNMEISISWRGLFEKTINIIDRETVSLSSLNLTKTESRDISKTYKISGKLDGGKPNNTYQLFVFPSIPWCSPPQKITINHPNNPNFNQKVQLENSTCWVLIFGAQSESKINNLLRVIPYNVDPVTLLHRTINLEKLSKESLTIWKTHIQEIKEQLHPFTASIFEETISEIGTTYKILERLDANNKWSFISKWDELERVLEYESKGFFISAFGSIPKHRKDPQVVSEFSLTMDGNNRNSFRYGKDSNNPIAGFLKKSFLGNIDIRSHDFFCLCNSCKLIIPQRYFNNHLPPSRNYVDCVDQNSNFKKFGPGHEIKNISLGILINSEPNYLDLMKKLCLVLEGKRDFSSEFKFWFQNLGKKMPSNANSREWLKGIVNLLRDIWSLYEKRHLKLLELKDITVSLNKYSDVIGLLLDKIINENELENT